MLEAKTILVPVDFSSCSKRALEYALKLAEVFKSRVEVVHVWQAPSFVSPDLMVYDAGEESISLNDWVRSEADKALSKFMKDYYAPEGAKLEAALACGDASDMILTIIENTKPDLVVMGTHGRTGFSRFLAGSVAEQTVRKALCPVLTVPPPTEERGKA